MDFLQKHKLVLNQQILKTQTIRITGLGIFIRKINSTLVKRKNEDKISMDDYILRPTNMMIRCGVSNQATPLEPRIETLNKAPCDSDDVQSLSSERVRRGKRDKRRKVDTNLSGDNRCMGEGLMSLSDTDFGSVATRNRMDSSTSQTEMSVNQCQNIDDLSLA
jgi:hypothetical protein